MCRRVQVVLVPLLLSAVAGGCASTVELQPIVQSAPREQAERIYAALLRREGLAPRRRDETLSGYAEAPDQIVRELEALAASSRDQEHLARVNLAAAMASTELYSKVRFENRPRDLAVRYRLMGRSEANAAHPGWNLLPVGLYESWGELNGKRVSEARAYEVLLIEVVLTGSRGQRQ